MRYLAAFLIAAIGLYAKQWLVAQVIGLAALGQAVYCVVMVFTTDASPGVLASGVAMYLTVGAWLLKLGSDLKEVRTAQRTNESGP